MYQPPAGHEVLHFDVHQLVRGAKVFDIDSKRKGVVRDLDQRESGMKIKYYDKLF